MRGGVLAHNAQLRNLCGARLLNRLDIGRATVVELDLRGVRFGSKADIVGRNGDVRYVPKADVSRCSKNPIIQ